MTKEAESDVLVRETRGQQDHLVIFIVFHTKYNIQLIGLEEKVVLLSRTSGVMISRAESVC